jgi:hypothetical protein
MVSSFDQQVAGATPEEGQRMEGERIRSSEGAHYVVPRRRPGDPLLFSFGQYRLWFLDQLTPGSSAYNITDMVRIHGALNISAFQRALDVIVQRHEVLRTNYVAVDGVPCPIVAEIRSAEFQEIDLRQIPASEREAEVQRLLRQEAARPFDLSRDAMLRVMLLQVADEAFVFFHNSHHSAWDLRSKFVFYEELSAFYRSFCMGCPAQLPELPIQYSDFALWQRRWLQGEVLEKLVSYWKEQLAGAPLKLELPTDYPRPPVLTYRSGPRVPMVLSSSLLAAVQALVPPKGLPLSKSLLWAGLSPFPALLAAFNVLLYAYSGQEDIVVSSPFSNRQYPETRALIGFFPNTMVLRTRVSGNLTFREFVVNVLGVTQSAILNAALPFEKIVESVRPVRRTSHLPLVQVNFRIQKAPLPTLELHGLSLGLPDTVDNAGSKFDLALELVTAEGLKGYFEYRADLFREATIVQMGQDFEELLAALISACDVPLNQLEFVQNLSRRHQSVSPFRREGI